MDTNINSKMEFYVNGVAIIIVAWLGLMGNILCIFLFLLKKLKLNQTFTNLLIWLAVIDSIFLVLVVFVFALPELNITYKQWIFPYMLPSVLPLTSIALTASVYTVVALTIERYLHLTKPQWSNKGSFFGYILPVLVFSTCYNFPKFFEFTTGITDKERTPFPQATDFRKNSDYSLYVLSINFFLMGMLPFSVLISLTVAISHQMKKVFSVLQPEGSNYKKNITATTTSLLTTIVVVQLICHFPRTGLNLYEVYTALKGEKFELTHTWMVDLSHLLLVISSSCNVIIYIIQDARFRSLLVSDLRRYVLIYRSTSSERSSNGDPETALANLIVDTKAEQKNRTEEQNRRSEMKEDYAEGESRSNADSF